MTSMRVMAHKRAWGKYLLVLKAIPYTHACIQALVNCQDKQKHDDCDVGHPVDNAIMIALHRAATICYWWWSIWRWWWWWWSCWLHDSSTYVWYSLLTTNKNRAVLKTWLAPSLDRQNSKDPEQQMAASFPEQCEFVTSLPRSDVEPLFL